MTDEDRKDVDFAKALGRAIAVQRTHLGVSRKELSVSAGISYPFISEIENGKKRASAESLEKIAKALNLSPAALYESAEQYGSVTTEHSTSRFEVVGSSEPAVASFAAAPVSRPGLDTDSVDRIVRQTLERWAVDVLPILVAQEVRRALVEEHRRNTDSW